MAMPLAAMWAHDMPQERRNTDGMTTEPTAWQQNKQSPTTCHSWEAWLHSAGAHEHPCHPLHMLECP